MHKSNLTSPRPRMDAEEFAPKSRLETTEAAVYDVNADRSKVTCEVQPGPIIKMSR